MNVTVEGKIVELEGTPVAVGEALPHFKLEDDSGNKVKTADLIGQLTLISVVPDLNTGTCTLQTRHFNKTVDQYPNIQFLTISTNTPAEQKDWCAAEGINNLKMLSDEQESFGYAMNLYVPALGFDTRALYIVDASGTVQYAQIVPEVADEPDYDDALKVLNQLMS